jgi:hypothetical protein
VKDVSRMRSILLQLKQSPPVRDWENKRFSSCIYFYIL